MIMYCIIIYSSGIIDAIIIVYNLCYALVYIAYNNVYTCT